MENTHFKKIRRVFCLFFFLSPSYTIYSQTLYEITYGVKEIYKGLLVYYNENDAYMRIAFTKSNGDYRVVNVKYKGTSFVSSNGIKCFSLTGSSPTYITQHSEEDSYNPDYFLWIPGQSLPSTTDDLSKNQWNVFPVRTYRVLNKNELTSSYLKQFYNSNEKDFLALVKTNVDDRNNYDTKKNSDGKFQVDDNDKVVTLHLFIAANTQISDIGQGCKIDEVNLITEFQQIASDLNINFSKYVIDGSDFTKQNFVNRMNSLSVNPNDIIIFFYRGHGYRLQNQHDSYPLMDFTYSKFTPATDESSMGLNEVYYKLIQKGARLNIILADCCNSVPRTLQQIGSNFLYTQSNINPNIFKIKELFLNKKGNLIASSSKPGETSWTSSAIGGFFTSSFLQALSEEVSYLKNYPADWSSVLNNTTQFALNKTEQCSSCTMQHGIFYSTIDSGTTIKNSRFSSDN